MDDKAPRNLADIMNEKSASATSPFLEMFYAKVLGSIDEAAGKGLYRAQVNLPDAIRDTVEAIQERLKREGFRVDVISARDSADGYYIFVFWGQAKNT